MIQIMHEHCDVMHQPQHLYNTLICIKNLTFYQYETGELWFSIRNTKALRTDMEMVVINDVIDDVIMLTQLGHTSAHLKG